MQDEKSRSIEPNCPKYSWGSLPNGKYAIVDVPVFQVFSDTQHGTVDQKSAQEILQNFEKDKSHGYFPRVFVGHHPDNSAENRPGAGFLNNLRFDGKFFWADIVEVPDEVFKEIQALKYPYRSVEYNDEKKKITGLALLESQPPFFAYPILYLEKSENLNKFQLNKCQVANIANSINAKGKKMDEEKKIDTGEKTKMVEEENDSLQSCQFKYQELSDGVGNQMAAIHQKLDGVIDALQELISMEAQEAQSKGTEQEPAEEQQMQDEEAGIEEVPEKIEDPDDSEIPEAPGDDEEKKIGKRPGSVAYQLSQIRKELSNLKRGKSYNAHPMSKMTGFSGKTNNFLAKFQDKPTSIKQVANEAMQAWQETSSHPNANVSKRFQAVWPDKEKFVDYIVKMEEIDPGHFKKMTM